MCVYDEEKILKMIMNIFYNDVFGCGCMARIVLVGVSKKEKAEKIIINVLRRRLEEIDDYTRDLRATIIFLEQKYGMSWEEFKKKFEEGSLSDGSDVDYVEWYAAVTLIEELMEEKRVLEDVLERKD